MASLYSTCLYLQLGFAILAAAAATTSAAAPAVPTTSSGGQQYFYVPASCNSTFLPGRDESLFWVSYPYDQVVGVIDDYKDLTWSGNPPDTVTLNGTNNTPGTTRFYSLQGVFTVETLLKYSRPAYPGPYVEVHNTAPVTFGTVSAYILYDGITATPVCGGAQTLLNYTAVFCSNSPATAALLLHNLHTQDEANVQTMLGGFKLKLGCLADFLKL